MYESDLMDELNNFNYVEFLKQKRRHQSVKKNATNRKSKRYGKTFKHTDTDLLIQDNPEPIYNNKIVSYNSECQTAVPKSTNKTMVSAPQSSKRSNHIENKESRLLTSSENQLIFKLLGERCQTLATSLIQLYCTSPPDHSTWLKRETGVLCFVKDNIKRSYFFRMYCPIRKRLIWQHEMYNNMEYKSPRAFFHTFEGEDSIIAFNFCNEDEAEYYKKIVLDKIAVRQRKERKTRSQGARISNISPNIQQTKSHTLATTDRSGTWTNTNGTSMLHANTINIANGGIVPQHHRSNSAGGQLIKTPDKQSIIKKRTRNLTTRDISGPSDFKHVSHVGWNATKGFEVTADLKEMDEHLKEFFAIAGISEKQLNDKDTCKFIYDFLEENGGIDAIKKDIKRDSTDLPGPSSQPPPVPARMITQQRAAPPPPTRTTRTPAPINNINRTVPNVPIKTAISIVNSGAPNVPPPPPPPPVSTTAPSAPIPPPPPPPPPFITNNIVNNSEDNRQDTKTDTSINSTPLAPPTDTRAALLESIRSGKKLKPVEIEKKPSPSSGNTDSRNDLLNEIRQGVELKSVTPNQPVQKPTLNHENGLAGALARALAERSRAIHSDSDTSDTSSEEDEWED